MIFCDDDLMVMFSAGVPEAFDMLYERYRHRIYGFARACLPNPSDAEEAVQEVFLSISRAAHRYEPRNRFRSWLFQIAANRIRTIATHPSVVTEALDTDDSTDTRFRSPLPSPDTIMMQRERIGSMLDQLTPDQKMIFLLREHEGLTMADIARIVNMSPENARVILHRARKRLSEAIADRRETSI